MSSDLGPDCEEILAGRPFYLRAGMSVSTGMSTCTAEHERERECESEGGQGGGRVCVSDARCRAVARAAPPLASLAYGARPLSMGEVGRVGSVGRVGRVGKVAIDPPETQVGRARAYAPGTV